MARESRQIRNFSFLSINRSSPSSSKSTDDLKTSPSPRPVRPASSTRGDSSSSRRLSILGLRAQRSMHDLGATLRDSVPSSHNRLSSLNLGKISPYNHEPSPPLPSSSRVSTPSNLPTTDRSPSIQSRGRPNSSHLLNEAELMPPPPIGGSFAERASSPGSRGSSKTRGRPESFSAGSPGNSRANSPSGDFQRPTTPNGKLNKKKTWSLGKSHGKSGSTVTVNQPWAFVVGTAGKQTYELSYLTKAQPVTMSRTVRNAFANGYSGRRALERPRRLGSAPLRPQFWALFPNRFLRDHRFATHGEHTAQWVIKEQQFSE